MRIRTVQASRGVAQPRGSVTPPPTERPGSWYPWYYGRRYYSPYSYYGHIAYSPWSYGGLWSSWHYGYGWHDPFLYDPYGYVGFAPYYWPSAAVGLGRNDDRDEGEPTGSLRLRVNPGHARVYIDGALAGVANEFGGLSDHLAIPAGRHQIELRADGYQTYTADVDVKAGRTQTERVNLRRE